MKSFNLLKQFIREYASDIADRHSSCLAEEIGRNYRTVDPDPITWESFADYDIDGYMTPKDRYCVTVTYKKGDPKLERVLVASATFRDQAEAMSRIRNIVDSHRVQAMNQPRG